MDLNEFRNTSNRLNPFRRLIAGIEGAVEAMTQFENLKAQAEAELQRQAERACTLERECQELEADRQSLQRDLEDARREYEADLAALTAAAASRREEHQQALADEQAALEGEKIRAHAEHSAYMASLAKGRQEAETELEYLQKSLASFREQLGRLL